MHTARSLAVVGVFVTVLSGCVSSESVDPAVAEAEIWKLEEAYFEHNQDADYEKIVHTWHDRFLGWPAPETGPIDKEEGTRYVRRQFQEPASFEFEIEPKGIQITGDIAVNFYIVRFKKPDPEVGERTTSLRITHTWLREDGEWTVLGGMSANEEKRETEEPGSGAG